MIGNKTWHPAPADLPRPMSCVLLKPFLDGQAVPSWRLQCQSELIQSGHKLLRPLLAIEIAGGPRNSLPHFSHLALPTSDGFIAPKPVRMPLLAAEPNLLSASVVRWPRLREPCNPPTSYRTLRGPFTETSRAQWNPDFDVLVPAFGIARAERYHCSTVRNSDADIDVRGGGAI